MSLNLPDPIATYFAGANARDADRVASSFAENGVVHDEGGDHTGRTAIRGWAEETGRKYHFQAEVLHVAEAGDQTIVTARISGTFPGSPIDLTHRFKLVDGLIASLSIG